MGASGSSSYGGAVNKDAVLSREASTFVNEERQAIKDLFIKITCDPSEQQRKVYEESDLQVRLNHMMYHY